ncbi:hypothetical protein BH09PLA1_BH09PLA1_19270 [soil metagenome]
MSDHDHSQATSRQSRYGLILFFVYVLMYGAFVYLSAFHADVMSMRPFGGVNLAVLYGLGLIVAAIVLALTYMVICRKSGTEGRTGGGAQ